MPFASGIISHPTMEEEETWCEALKWFVVMTDEEELGKCFMTWCGIWAERNKVWQDIQIQSPQQIGWIVASNFHLYQIYNDKQPHEDFDAMLARKWLRLEYDFVKVNVDYAAFPTNNTHGIGIIIKDSNAIFVAAQSWQQNGMLDPFEGELKAARDGLRLAFKLGLAKIVLESDSMLIWRSIRDEEVFRSYRSNIMKDILYYSYSFRSFKCGFAPRHCNRAAYTLANFAKDSLFQL